MSQRIVLLTRSSRPSGAQMAWRLCESGLTPCAVIVERRGRMMKGRPAGSPLRLGIRFLFKKILEAVQIRAQFYLRKFLGKRFQNPVYLSIEEFALDYPVKLYWVEDHNSQETAAILRELKPDIGVLTNTRRIHKEILSIPRHGFLNLHSSLLPKYAGLESIFWALYHGEKEIGVTVHFAAEKIDEGDIVLQRKIEAGPFDNPDTLNEKARWLGTALMVRAIRQLEEGTLERIPQNQENASYFSWPTAKERRATHHRVVPTDSGRPRALHIITRMIRGGAQENTLATVLGLSEKGYDVTLVTGPSWGKEGEILSEALEQGVEVVIIPELIREVSPINDAVALWKLFRMIRKMNCEIVHTHTSKAGLLGRIAAHWAGAPHIVHTPHGHIFHSYFSGWKEKLFAHLERHCAKYSERLIALTEICKNEHLEMGIGKPDQWSVIPSGVDEKKFDPMSSRHAFKPGSNMSDLAGMTIGFIGRLAPIKGPRYFMEALPAIHKAFPETQFLIAGDGEERTFLESKVREYGLSAQVQFLGHLEDVAGPLSMMDILVVPSLNEGMGRVIVEAGLLGKAVVASRTGGIPDLIEDGLTGILVPAADPAAIAEAVIRLLQNPDAARSLGEHLKEKMLAGFTERHMVEQIHGLYQKILNRETGLKPAPVMV